MKKNIFYTFIFVLLMLSTSNVNAANICTGKKLGDLKAKAYQSQLTYEQKFDKNHNSYFEVTIYNVDKDVLVMYSGSTYEVDDTGIVKLETMFEGGITYEISFYGGYNTDCVEEYLYTKRLTLPVYNYYSEREECIEYEEFPLCNKWYKGTITDEQYFLDQLELYKESLIQEEPPKPVEEEKNLFESIIAFYMDNIKITLPVTIVILVLISVLTIRSLIRRKNRIKLKME